MYDEYSCVLIISSSFPNGHPQIRLAVNVCLLLLRFHGESSHSTELFICILESRRMAIKARVSEFNCWRELNLIDLVSFQTGKPRELQISWCPANSESEHLKAYCSMTTLHRFTYLADGRSHRIERLNEQYWNFWFLRPFFIPRGNSSVCLLILLFICRFLF